MAREKCDEGVVLYIGGYKIWGGGGKYDGGGANIDLRM